jgi:hypothetical protein
MFRADVGGTRVRNNVRKRDNLRAAFREEGSFPKGHDATLRADGTA